MKNKIVVLTLLAAVSAIPVLAQNNAPKPKDITIDGVEGFQDTPMQPDGHGTSTIRRGRSRRSSRPGTFSENATPPSDAIVLFDGKDLSHWRDKRTGGPAPWTIEDGVMVSAKGDIRDDA